MMEIKKEPNGPFMLNYKLSVNVLVITSCCCSGVNELNLTA
uniref:Uncharacterized protein n=1 Tax=Myoviridae sp. ctCo31 TaxID=2825053 RepID=A0A8S5UM45_9CAUD|nr:MAG TPA: hypothetical protein [Myoviridae sp. ctCo31]